MPSTSIGTLASSPAAQRNVLLAATAAWTASGVVLYVLAPLIAPILLPLCIVAPLGWYWTSERRLPEVGASVLLLTLVLAGIYLTINATWSLSPSSAYTAAFLFLGIVLILYVISGTLWQLQGEVLRALALGLYAGVVVGGIFLCFEVLTEQWLRRMLMQVLPGMQPNPRDMFTGPGGVVTIAPYLVNRSIASLTLMLWPTVLAAKPLARDRRQHGLMLLALLPALAAILFSAHETSKLALAGGLALFGVAHLSYKAARNLAIGAWVAAICLVVPLAYWAYASQIYRSPWLFDSAQARVVIWGHTSEQVLKAPVLGSGIATARALHDPEGGALAPGSTHRRLTTGLHSHNAYLQAWYETGAVGSAFLLAIGVLIVRLFESVQANVRGYLLALFGTCALLEASSFSMWAPWLMSSLGMTAAFATLGCALAARQTEAVSPPGLACEESLKVKRAFDLVGAGLGLIVLWPVILAAVIAIRLNSPGPGILAQRRIGRNRREFTCYKLRTMHANTAQLPTHQVGASALTSIGGFLRRSKLDELPQLYNVVRGEMSLVGPRPCLPSQTELIDARSRRGALSVPPGITGLAQVHGIDMSDPVRLACTDAVYARTRSFGGDLRLILQTLTGAGVGIDPARGATARR